MANVAHASLSGADLHEPKGIGSAAASTVYVANGAGSGTWSSVATLINFVGMIADFETPIVPTGWLEYDGSTVSRTTYADLFAARTIQGNGTRTSGSAIITNLASTTHMRAGYYIGGTGITNGTTILSVDSATQVTMSATASSSGTNNVIVSPWALGDGSTTFTLGDTKTAGRFRRSRTASVHMGQSQADQNKSHTHTGTSDAGGVHTHTGTTDNGGVDHNHLMGLGASFSVPLGAGVNVPTSSPGNGPTAGASAYLHTHTFTTDASSSHTHTFTTDASGSSEARPVAVVVMTCVKY